MKMRGTSAIDWAAGFIIFLFALTTALFYMRYISHEKVPFEEVMEEALSRLEDGIYENCGTKILIYRINMDKNVSVSYYPFVTGLQNTSMIAVTNSLGVLPFAKENEVIRFLANTTSIPIIVESDEIVKNTQITDVWISDDALGNGKIMVNYSVSNLTQITYSTGFLTRATDLFTSLITLRKKDATQSTVIYNNLNLSVDAFSGRIWIKSESKRNLTFYLKPFLSNFYIGNASYSFKTTSYVNELSNLTSLFNNTLAISFIGTSLNVSVENGTNERIVKIYDVDALEIYLHEGNYSNAINESLMFGKNVVEIATPIKLVAITNQSLFAFSQKSYKEQKNLLDLKDMEFMAEVENITIGQAELPLLANIHVKVLPIIFLTDDGMLKRVNMTVWLWM
jgi:hypothetical protein